MPLNLVSPRNSHQARSRFVGAMFTLFVLVCSAATVGCAPSSSSSDDDTLNIVSGLKGFGSIERAYEAVVEAFIEANPDIDVNYQAITFDELTTTSRLKLTSNEPPDLINANQGYESLGAFAEAGLLEPLDGYATEYGWDERLPESFLAANGRFSDDGRMGEGNLWGVSTSLYSVALWMNKEVAERLGITKPPRSLADLEAQMQIAADNGVVPFELGTSDGSQGAWLLTSLMASIGGKDAVESVVFHNGQGFDTPAAVEAATTISDWADRGFFTPDWTAYSNDDALRRMLDGEGLFTLNGSWYLPMGDDDDGRFSILNFPTADGDSVTGVLAGDQPWVMPKRAGNKEEAAKFIDFVFSDEGQRIFLSYGVQPAVEQDDADSILRRVEGSGPALVDALATGTNIAEADGAVPFLDWSGAGLYAAIHAAVDELAAGRISPDEFVSQLQGAYTSAATG